MAGKLLELETKKLPDKFGAGNHKPESGSIVAFNGLLAANLIDTKQLYLLFQNDTVILRIE
ncbi:MAG: hypothetical protein GDA42_12145 [Ekhidna sp.]|nr:hypothetical protein [Ekhidna sp.]